MTAQITIRGARLHNLKNVTLTIPKNQLVVLTGVSGSGKSTLAFDILHKESLRQYMEFDRHGHPTAWQSPGRRHHRAVPRHQRGPAPHQPQPAVHGRHHHRHLYLSARAVCPPGPPPLPRLRPRRPPAPSTRRRGVGERIAGRRRCSAAPKATFPCPHCGAPVPRSSMAHFSFNKPDGACPTCTGLGTVQQANLERLVDEHKSILAGAYLRLGPRHITYYTAILEPPPPITASPSTRRCRSKTTPRPQRDLLFFGVDSPRFRRHFPTIAPPATVRQGRFEGIATNLLRRYAEHLQHTTRRPITATSWKNSCVTETCPDCAGTRLRPESRVVTVNGQTIVELSRLPLSDLVPGWTRSPPCSARMKCSSPSPSWATCTSASARLVEVGAGYLSLDRASPTLSAGEAQRLRLAVVARLVLERRAVRVRRADHRAAPARYPPPDRRLAPLARPGQHRPRHRTRPGNDRRRRLRGRLRPRRRQARRAGGRRRDPGGSGRAARRRSPAITWPGGPPSRSRRAAARPTGPALDHPRRAPAQPPEHHGALPAGRAGRGDGGLRVGQILAGLRHPRPCRSAGACMARATPPANTTRSKAANISTRSSPLTRSTSGASRARTPRPTRIRLPRSATPLPRRRKRAAGGYPPGTSRSTSRAGAASAAKAPAS